MENDQDLNPEPYTGEYTVPIICIRCSNTNVLHGYPNALCADCRKHLINFPIPIWVKLFGAGIILVMLISMIWLPANFMAAINLARAEKAEQRHEFLSEQKGLEKVLKTVPNSDEALLHLIIASFNTRDLKALYTAANALGSKRMEDTALVNRVNLIMDEAKLYNSDSTYSAAFDKKYKNLPAPDTAYISYIKLHPKDIYAIYSLASVYADQEKYSLADSTLSKLLTIQNRFIPALTMETMVKRELGQIDASLKYCNQLLEINRQDLYAMSSKARTLIKKGKNVEGLALAQQCYALDSNDAYNTSTLVLAYHFNNDIKKRDEMIVSAKKDSLHASYFKYVQDAISNKVKYQN